MDARYLTRPTVLPKATGTGNGSVAPVCPVSGSQRPPGMPGTMLTTPTRAVDLPTLITTVNQVAQILQYLYNPPVPSTPTPPHPKTTPITPAPGVNFANDLWYEVPDSRKYTTVLYVQGSDPNTGESNNNSPQVIRSSGTGPKDLSVYDGNVIVMKLITAIKFKSKAGKGTLEWKRGPITTPGGYQEGAYDEGGGDTYPPYREDWLQNVVNVYWESGLAVEFFDGAS